MSLPRYILYVLKDVLLGHMVSSVNSRVAATACHNHVNQTSDIALVLVRQGLLEIDVIEVNNTISR